MVKKIKNKKKVIKKVLKPVAQYIGNGEKYVPNFKQKLINKGDILPEMPITEAKSRRDFKVIYKEE